MASSNINDHRITLNVTGDELSSSAEYVMDFNLPKPGVGGGDLTGVPRISFSQTDTAGTDSFEVYTSGQKAAGNPGDGLFMYLKSAVGTVTSFQPYFITIGAPDDTVHTRINAGGSIELKSSTYSLPKLSFAKNDLGAWDITYDSSGNLSFTLRY